MPRSPDPRSRSRASSPRPTTTTSPDLPADWQRAEGAGSATCSSHGGVAALLARRLQPRRPRPAHMAAAGCAREQCEHLMEWESRWRPRSCRRRQPRQPDAGGGCRGRNLRVTRHHQCRPKPLAIGTVLALTACCSLEVWSGGAVETDISTC